jgi:hypothetical protein
MEFLGAGGDGSAQFGVRSGGKTGGRGAGVRDHGLVALTPSSWPLVLASLSTDCKMGEKAGDDFS